MKNETSRHFIFNNIFIQDSLLSSQGELLSMRVLRSNVTNLFSSHGEMLSIGSCVLVCFIPHVDTEVVHATSTH